VSEINEIIRLARKGKAAESRGKAVTGCIGGFIAAFAVIALRAWIGMLGVAAIHQYWIPAVPRVGFLTAVIATVAFRVVFMPDRETKQ
jgi:hypothetical protein